MIKRGLQILKTKQQTTQNERVTFKGAPPLYNLFTQLFELGEDGFLYERYYNKPKDKFYYIQEMYYEPRGRHENDISFTHFDKIEAVIHNWENKYGYTDQEIDLDLLRVGGIALGGGLFIGTRNNETDKVYLTIWDSTEGLIQLDNNIFEFANNLILEEVETLDGGVLYSQLYKNWGEEYWNAREDF